MLKFALVRVIYQLFKLKLCRPILEPLKKLIRSFFSSVNCSAKFSNNRLQIP